VPWLGRRRGGEKQRGGRHSSDFGGGKKEVASTALPCLGEKGGLAGEAHVGAELEATAWSATLTRMRWSWAVAGRLTRRAGRESKGVRWGAVAMQADLIRKVGSVARPARNEQGHFLYLFKNLQLIQI
jgi:hypothetical protein